MRFWSSNLILRQIWDSLFPFGGRYRRKKNRSFFALSVWFDPEKELIQMTKIY